MAARPPLRRHALTDEDRRRAIGRVQRQVRRAFIASAGEPLRIGQLLRWCYPRQARFKRWHRNSVRRAARRFAQPIDRDSRGVVWAPLPALAALVARHGGGLKNSPIAPQIQIAGYGLTEKPANTGISTE